VSLLLGTVELCAKFWHIVLSNSDCYVLSSLQIMHTVYLVIYYTVFITLLMCEHENNS